VGRGLLDSSLGPWGPEVSALLIKRSFWTLPCGLLAGNRLAFDVKLVCLPPLRPLLPMMQRNVVLNDLESTISVEQLNWSVCTPLCLLIEGQHDRPCLGATLSLNASLVAQI
jgi:hypothetical protein